MAWLVVDKDGTENIFNERPFRGDRYPQICKKYGINHHNPDKFKDKWYNTFTDGYFQVPKNTGVQLPSGTIKLLINKSLTWEDEPIKYE